MCLVIVVTFVIFKLMNSRHWVWFYLHLNIDVSALTHATTVSFHVSCYHLVAKNKTICIISYIWNNWQAAKPHCWWCSAALALSTHLQTNNNNSFDSWFIRKGFVRWPLRMHYFFSHLHVKTRPYCASDWLWPWYSYPNPNHLTPLLHYVYDHFRAHSYAPCTL